MSLDSHASLASASSSSSMSTASPAKNSNPTSPTACELPCLSPRDRGSLHRPPAASCGKSTCLAHFALTAAALAQTRSVSGEHLGQACRELLCWTERDRGAAGCSETGGSELPSGRSEATEARPSLPRTPSLKGLGPSLRAGGPQGARLEFLLVALADDWLSKDLPVQWRGGRCRAWPGPAAGGGSDRVCNWVPGTVLQLDRPPQQFPRDLNGSRGSDPHSKSRGSRESPWPVERIPSNA